MTKVRLRDLAVEVLIAIVLVGGLVLWARSVPLHTPFPTKWVGLIVFTFATFGDTLQWCRQHWRLVRFWLAFSILLLGHSVVFTLVFFKLSRWPLIWFVPVGAVEFPLLRLILGAVGRGAVKDLWAKSGTVSR